MAVVQTGSAYSNFSFVTFNGSSTSGKTIILTLTGDVWISA